MDILKAATTQARPQYRVIISPESGCFLPVKSHTELEIGFGNGEFTVQYAMLHPEIMLYGLEISPACVLRCARRSAGLKNLRIINTDARYMLKELFSDESLDRIIMQFPCPWSGISHAHRRVTAKDFAGSLAAVLKIGAEFLFVSDDEEYSQEVKHILGSHEALELVSFELNPQREITTKYERKWLEQGKNIHVLTFRKTHTFTIARQVDTQDMHIKIRRQVEIQDIESLTNTSGSNQTAKTFWKFGHVFTGSNAFLLETLTSDDEFEQKFYIHVSGRDDGMTLIRLDKITMAFLTPAVKAALEDVSRKLSQ